MAPIALNAEGYAKTYATVLKYESNTEELEAIQNKIKEHFGEKSISLMSVGAGTGSVDDWLIREGEGLKVSRLWAVEPNKDHAEKLRLVAQEWERDNGIEVSIDTRRYDTDYQLDEQFEVILFVHSLYYIGNIEEIIKHSRKFLKPNGIIILNVSAISCGYNMHDVVVSWLGVEKGCDNHRLTIEKVHEMLTEASITHDMQTIDSLVDVSECMTGQNNDVMDFYTQYYKESLDKELQRKLMGMMEDESVTRDGRVFMKRKNGMIVVKKENI